MISSDLQTILQALSSKSQVSGVHESSGDLREWLEVSPSLASPIDWGGYPLVNIQKTIENDHLYLDLPVKNGDFP